jgi:peptide/nickel transport system permease protein
MEGARPRQKWPTSAKVAGCVLALYVLVAFLGYLISPDDSPQANRQLLELSRLTPNSHVEVVQIREGKPKENVNLFEKWWGGQPIRYRYYTLKPESKLSFEGDKVQITRPNGQTEWIEYRNSLAKIESDKESDAQLRFEQEHRMTLYFWLGTDALGRDMLSRLILGSRISLGVGFLAVLLSIVLGVSIGLLAGYFGGWLDSILMGITAVLWALPSLVLALALSFAFGRGLQQLFLTVGLCIWVELARVVRGQVMKLKVQPFVEAAGMLGFGPTRIVLRHILPNLAGTILILAMSNLVTAILLEAGLSFLGMGVSSPTPSWGGMIQESYPYLLLQKGQWLAVFPGLVMVVLILCLNFVLEGLRTRLSVGHE